MMRNFYDILEVSRRASDIVIDAAFEVLNEHYSDDDREWGEIDEAYGVLSDPVWREAYDKQLDTISPGKIIGGNYRILKEIAKGGFGTTYTGEHLMTGKPVCIKHAHLVSPQDEQLLLDEAGTIWDLRHYGIPVIRDIIKLEDGSLCLVMSLIPGSTLERIVAGSGGLDAEHVAWIADRILNILKYLHFHGVVHGDLKPQNVIVQAESHLVVLVDYGLSVIRPKPHGTNKGFTPLFASPEQEQGDTLLPEADFYSLGMTMIYCLGGDVKAKQVPQNTPKHMRAFINRLIVRDVLSRPRWDNEDLMETLKEVRKKDFGREFSGMKPLPTV